MPASREEVLLAKEEGIELSCGWGLKSVVTDGSGKVTGLESKRCVRVRDEKGRFSPEYDENDVTVYEAKSIILATGQSVDTDFLGEKFGAQLKTERGLFRIDRESYQTENEKIYAGGDAATGPDIAIRAIRAGRQAARNMSSKMGCPIAPLREKESGFLRFDPAGIGETKAGKDIEKPVAERDLTGEDTCSMTVEEAQKEAGRCMHCGCYSVNASDLSPVLVALNGTVITTKKEIPAGRFFTEKLRASDMLDPGEIVKAVRVPNMEGYETGYIKSRIRPSIDFAIVSLAYAYKMEDGRISDISLTLGGVAPVPVKASAAEQFLTGKEPTEENAKTAAELALGGSFRDGKERL